MSIVAAIAWTHLRVRMRQTFLSVLGTATGVGFAIAMASLMQGSQDDFIRRVVDVTPHVVVRDDFRKPAEQPVEQVFADGAVAIRGQTPKEELRGIRNPHARVAALSALPGVMVAPSLRGQVVVRYGGKDVAVSLVGIVPRREAQVSRLADDMIQGTIDDLPTAANGIIIGRGLANRLRADVGATLSVTSPAGVPRKMKVVGLFHTGVLAIDEGTAYALLKKVQVLLDRPNIINEIRLRVDDPRRARPVARRIEAWIGYRTESWDEANEGVLQVFVVRNTIMYTVVGSILLVAAFGIYNIVSTITHEKTHDIAILKSLGFRERDIRRLFLLEGVLMGTAGAALGWVLGYGLYRILGTVEIKAPGMAEAANLPVTFEPLHYVVATAAALAAAAVASYLPARRAARLNPVDIIRGAA